MKATYALGIFSILFITSTGWAMDESSSIIKAKREDLKAQCHQAAVLKSGVSIKKSSSVSWSSFPKSSRYECLAMSDASVCDCRYQFRVKASGLHGEPIERQDVSFVQVTCHSAESVRTLGSTCAFRMREIFRPISEVPLLHGRGR